MNEKGVIPLIVIIIIAIVGLVAVFVFSKNTSIFNETPISTQPASNQSEVVETSHVYTNEEEKFSFEYPKELEPYTYSNGVVAFFNQEDIENCKKFQETQSSELQYACYKAIFNLSGFKVLSQNDYLQKVSSQTSEDVYTPRTIVDSQNRTWKTFQMLGEAFNFDAYTAYNNNYLVIHFQSQDERRNFFHQLLSSVKILE